MKLWILALLIPFSMSAQLRYNTYKNFYYSTQIKDGLNPQEYNHLACIVAQVIQASYMNGYKFMNVMHYVEDALEENGSVAAITLKDDLKLMW